MYAVLNLEGRALQVNSLLETEGGKVLGILVQHLSVENLVTVRIVQPSSWRSGLRWDTPNDQSSSGPDVLPFSERVLGHRGDWEGELGEAWDGGNSDHCLEAGRGNGGRMRGDVSASMGRVQKGSWDPQDDPSVQESLHPKARWIILLRPDHPSCPLTATQCPTHRVLPATNGTDGI